MAKRLEMLLSRGFALFGILLAIPAVLDLGATFSLFELTGFSLSLVDLYKELLSPIFLLIISPIQLLLKPLGLEIPVWVINIQALSITGGGIFFRAANAAYEKMDSPLDLDIREYMDDYGIKRQTNLFYLKVLLVSLVGFGVLVVAASVLMIPVTLIHHLVAKRRNTGLDMSNIAFQGAVQMAMVLISCFVALLSDYAISIAA